MVAVAAAPDLDCLIAAHDKFLTSVLDRALLGSGKAEALRVTLTHLLTNCMDLAGPVRQLKDKVRTVLQVACRPESGCRVLRHPHTRHECAGLAMLAPHTVSQHGWHCLLLKGHTHIVGIHSRVPSCLL